jgi:hypothetical protein
VTSDGRAELGAKWPIRVGGGTLHRLKHFCEPPTLVEHRVRAPGRGQDNCHRTEDRQEERRHLRPLSLPPDGCVHDPTRVAVPPDLGVGHAGRTPQGREKRKHGDRYGRDLEREIHQVLQQKHAHADESARGDRVTVAGKAIGSQEEEQRN